METLTDRLAEISPRTVVTIVALLTGVRVALALARGRGPGTPVGRLLGDLVEPVLIALVLVFLLLRPFVAQTFYIPTGSMRPTLWEGDRILVNKWVYRSHYPQRGEVIVFRSPEAASVEQKDFIKRLVAVAGDQIEIREGYVLVGEDRIFTRGEVRAQLGLARSVSEEAVDASPAPLRLTSDAIWVGRRKISKAEFARAAGTLDPAAVRIVPGSVWRNGVMLCESYVAEDPGYKCAPQIVPPGHLFVLGDNRNQSADSHEWGMLPEGRVIGRADLVFWPPSNIKRIVHDHGSGAGER